MTVEEYVDEILLRSECKDLSELFQMIMDIKELEAEIIEVVAEDMGDISFAFNIMACEKYGNDWKRGRHKQKVANIPVKGMF